MKSLLLAPLLLVVLLLAIPANAQITVFKFPTSSVVHIANNTLPTPNQSVIDNATALTQQIQNLEEKLSHVKSLAAIVIDQKEKELLKPILAYDQIKGCDADQHMPVNTTYWYKTYLTDFRCGHVHVAVNGTVYRDFTMFVDDYNHTGKPWPISVKEPFTKYDPVIFHAWTFNGTVPGPTLRFTVGDHVSINLFNSKDSAFAHGMHMHSIHSGYMDGVPGISPGGAIPPGQNFTFHFIANPAGVFPYHCHMDPVIEHIGRGLYGQMIIDPITPRPEAKEMVMMLNGYSFNFQGLSGKGFFKAATTCTMAQMRANLSKCEDMAADSNEGDNQFYTVNGMPFGYDPFMGGTPIHLNVGTHYRIYLTNMLELDPINNFHIHGTMFYATSSGTFSSGIQYTDILALMQGDRYILQFTYPYPGMYMIHSHHNHFSELGWLAFAKVDFDHSYEFFK